MRHLHPSILPAPALRFPYGLSAVCIVRLRPTRGDRCHAPVPGRLGTANDRFVLLDGHDSNLTWLGGLLRMDWLLPDQTFNATPPGSALVFEVHRAHGASAATVQVFFISQTLDQTRSLTSLTVAEPPSIAPVFVPGCSGPAPEFACTAEAFARIVDAAIDRRFVSDAPR